MESSYLITLVNHTEARQWLSMAEKMLTDHDWSGCKKCVVRARDMDSRLSRMVDEITVIADTLQARTRQMATDKPDWYDILGMTPSQGLNPEVVANRYHNLTYILNPHRNKFPFAERAIGMVHDAWAILSDPTRKSAYDRDLDFYLQPPCPHLNTVVNDPMVANTNTSSNLGHLPTNFSQPHTIEHNQQLVEPLVGGLTHLPNPTGDFNLLSSPGGSGMRVIPTSQPPALVHAVVSGSTRLPKPSMTYVTDFNLLFSPRSGTTPALVQLVGGSTQPSADFNLLARPGRSGITNTSGMSQPAKPPPTMSSLANCNLLFRPRTIAACPMYAQQQKASGPTMSSTTATAADCNLAFVPASGPNSRTWPHFPRIDSSSASTTSVLNKEEQWHALESQLLQNHWDGLRLNDANKNSVVTGKVVQVEKKRSNLTLWTMCPSCYFMHQYPTKFVNLALKCQNCSRPFIALEIKSPPLANVTGQEAYYAGFRSVAGPSSSFPPQAGKTSGMKSLANIDDKNKVTVEILDSDGDDGGPRVKKPRLWGDENVNVDNTAATVDQAPEMYKPDFGIDPDEFFNDFGQPALGMSQETWQEDDIKGDFFENLDEYLSNLPDCDAKADQ